MLFRVNELKHFIFFCFCFFFWEHASALLQLFFARSLIQRTTGHFSEFTFHSHARNQIFFLSRNALRRVQQQTQRTCTKKGEKIHCVWWYVKMYTYVSSVSITGLFLFAFCVSATITVAQRKWRKEGPKRRETLFLNVVDSSSTLAAHFYWEQWKQKVWLEFYSNNILFLRHRKT